MVDSRDIRQLASVLEGLRVPLKKAHTLEGSGQEQDCTAAIVAICQVSQRVLLQARHAEVLYTSSKSRSGVLGLRRLGCKWGAGPRTWDLHDLVLRWQPFSITAAVTFTALGKTIERQLRRLEAASPSPLQCLERVVNMLFTVTAASAALQVNAGGKALGRRRGNVMPCQDPHPLFPSAESSQCIFVSRRCGLSLVETSREATLRK